MSQVCLFSISFKASKQSEYVMTSRLANSVTPIHDSLHSPTSRRVTNAACIAYQRSKAKENAETRKRQEQSRFTGVCRCQKKNH